jgi:4-hydroxy-4-methyl-2-oxoglutarate aldolase
VHAGDLVVADADGVTVVERARVEGLLPLARRKVEDETARIAQIREGLTLPSWLSKALCDAGVLAKGESL